MRDACYAFVSMHATNAYIHIHFCPDRMFEAATHVNIRHLILYTSKTHIIYACVFYLSVFCVAPFGLKLFDLEPFSSAASIN